MRSKVISASLHELVLSHRNYYMACFYTTPALVIVTGVKSCLIYSMEVNIIWEKLA